MGRVDIAASFNALPARTRRSSEVVGLLQRLDQTPATGLAIWHCVDTDDRELAWVGPNLTLSDEQLALLKRP